jgi:hypothetical protein
MNETNAPAPSKFEKAIKEAVFLDWYDTFVDAMRNANGYKGALDMEAAKMAFDTGKFSPTEYAEFLINQ